MSQGWRIHLQGKRCGFDPWVGKIPWRKKGQPTPVFLPEKSHGQRSLAGYSPWGHRRVGHNWSSWHSLTVVKTLGKSYLHWITQPQKGKQNHMIIKDPRKDYTGYLVLEQKQRAWHRRDGGTPFYPIHKLSLWTLYGTPCCLLAHP